MCQRWDRAIPSPPIFPRRASANCWRQRSEEEEARRRIFLITHSFRGVLYSNPHPAVRHPAVRSCPISFAEHQRADVQLTPSTPDAASAPPARTLNLVCQSTVLSSSSIVTWLFCTCLGHIKPPHVSETVLPSHKGYSPSHLPLDLSLAVVAG